MAYDELLFDRISRTFQELGINAEAKRLMGGLCFVLQDKMCVGTSIDKTNGKPRLIARIGEAQVLQALKNDYCLPFQPTGKVMKDFVSIYDEGIDSDESLTKWVKSSIDFNLQLNEKKT